MNAQQSMAAQLPSYLHGLRQVHVGLRRDAQRLRGAAQLLPAESDRIASWWRKEREVLDWHLDTKEHLLFPRLARLSPDWALGVPALVSDHEAIRAAARSVASALSRASNYRFADPAARIRGEVAQSSAWFCELLERHLAIEEQQLWPLLSQQLSAADFRRLERRVLQHASPSTMAYLLPWILDGLEPGAAAGVLSTMPPPIRALGRTALRWRYQRRRWW